MVDRHGVLCLDPDSQLAELASFWDEVAALPDHVEENHQLFDEYLALQSWIIPLIDYPEQAGSIGFYTTELLLAQVEIPKQPIHSYGSVSVRGLLIPH